MEMALVLDASGSIAGFEAVDDVARLGSAIAEKLTNRNIDLTIVEFATFADTPIASVPLTTANVLSVFEPYFDGTASPHYFDRRTGLYTNWEDGFTQLHNMETRPDLVIFVSDGKANTIGDRTVAVNGNASHAFATASAIKLADELKAEGTHVIGVGVGDLNNDEGRALVQSLSGGSVLADEGLGVGDFFVGEFSELFRIVNEFPRDICEGTTTITSLIDADGDLSTTGDQTAAIGWPITLSDTNGDFRTSSATTGPGGSIVVTPNWAENGKARFKFAIEQRPLPGYDVVSMTCTRARERGQFDGDFGLRGIEIARNNLTECTIINVQEPAELDFDLETILIDDVDGDGTNSPGDVIYYKATARNTGGMKLTDVHITSDFIDWTSCSRRQGAGVPVGKKMVCRGSYIIQEADAGERIVHDASADSKQTGAKDDRETEDVPALSVVRDLPVEPVGTPRVELEKVIVRTEDVDGNDRISVGDIVHYELRIENTGTVALTDVSLEDPLAIPDCGGWTDGLLAPQTSVTCSAAIVIDDAHALTDLTNTATVTSAQTEPVDDSAQISVPLRAICRGNAVLFDDSVVLLGQSDVTVSANTRLDPGSYSLRLAGVDWGHELGWQTHQTQESFVVEFLDQDGAVVSMSAPSVDIPEADRWLIADVPGVSVFDREVVSARARHVGTPGANSVSPICVELTRVG